MGVIIIAVGVILGFFINPTTLPPTIENAQLVTSNRQHWDNASYKYEDCPTEEIDLVNMPDDYDTTNNLSLMFTSGSSFFDCHNITSTSWQISLKPNLIADTYSFSVKCIIPTQTNYYRSESSPLTDSVQIHRISPSDVAVSFDWNSTAAGDNKFQTTSNGCKIYLNYASNEAPIANINISKPNDVDISYVDINTDNTNTNPGCFQIIGSVEDGYQIKLRGSNEIGSDVLLSGSAKVQILVHTSDSDNYYPITVASEMQTIEFMDGIIPSDTRQTSIGSWSNNLVYGYSTSQSTITTTISNWNSAIFPLSYSYDIDANETDIPSDKISIIDGNKLQLEEGVNAGSYKVTITTNVAVTGDFSLKFPQTSFQTEFTVQVARKTISAQFHIYTAYNTSADVPWLENGIETFQTVLGFLNLDTSNIPDETNISYSFAINTQWTSSELIPLISINRDDNTITITANLQPGQYDLYLNCNIESANSNYVEQTTITQQFNITINKGDLSTKGISLEYPPFTEDFNNSTYRATSIMPIISSLPVNYDSDRIQYTFESDISSDILRTEERTGEITINPGLTQKNTPYWIKIHPTYTSNQYYNEWNPTEAGGSPTVTTIYIYCGVQRPIASIFDVQSLNNNEYGGRLFVPTSIYGNNDDLINYIKTYLLPSSALYDGTQISISYPPTPFNPSVAYGNFNVTFTATGTSTKYEPNTSVTIPCTCGITPIMKDNFTTINNLNTFNVSQTSTYQGNRLGYLAFQRGACSGNSTAGWFANPANYQTEDPDHPGYFLYSKEDNTEGDSVTINFEGDPIHMTGYQLFSRKNAGNHYTPKWKIYGKDSFTEQWTQITENEQFTLPTAIHQLYFSCNDITDANTYSAIRLVALEGWGGSSSATYTAPVLGDFIIFGY